MGGIYPSNWTSTTAPITCEICPFFKDENQAFWLEANLNMFLANICLSYKNILNYKLNKLRYFIKFKYLLNKINGK